MTERYSFKLIWGDMALPELACSFRLAVGPTKMILAFSAVLVVCTLGFIMDTCYKSVAARAQTTSTGIVITRTELDVYLQGDLKQTKAFIDERTEDEPGQGVFGTLWAFVSGRFHDAVTQLLNLSDTNIFSNIRYAMVNIWVCVRAVGWAFRFHPIYSCLYFSIAFLVFVFAGGAISRCAALEFAKAEKPGLFEVISYAAQNYRSFLSAPLLPLGMVGIFAFVVIILGLLAAIPVAGELLMVLLFAFVLLFGFLVTLMTLGAIAGGILLFPSIAYERTTGLDSIGRAFSYVLSCPIWMVYYVLLSGILGAFFYLVLRLLIFLALQLTYTLLLAGLMIVQAEDKLERLWPKPDVLSFVHTAVQSQTWSESVSAFVIRLFMLGIIGLLLSYIISYFYSSATVVYALMRKKVDGISTDQIYVHLEHVTGNE